jgi:hypothetical protein
MRTPCERVERQLSRYHDGELGRLDGWRVRGHLQRCARCARLGDQPGGLDRQVTEALVSPPVPAYLSAAVMRRLPAMPPASAAAFRMPVIGGSRLPRLSMGWARWLLGAGCAALQVAALCGAYRYGYTRGQTEPAAPARPPVRSAAPAVGYPMTPLPSRGLTAWSFRDVVEARPGGRRRPAAGGRLSLQGAR